MVKIKFNVFCYLFVVFLSTSLFWIYVNPVSEIYSNNPVEYTKRSREEVLASCQKHIDEAKIKAEKQINWRTKSIVSFVNKKKKGAKEFSEEIVSWYGKWLLLESGSPFGDEDGYKSFVSIQFTNHIFPEMEFALELKRAIDNSLKDIEAIENDLAVNLRQEIIGESSKPDEKIMAKQWFGEALETLIVESQKDAVKAVSRLVFTEVAAQVTAPVLMSVGVSAGVLTVATINSYWTFGTALVVGVLTDHAIGIIISSQKNVESATMDKLNDISLKASNVLEIELTKILNKRVDLWEKTLLHSTL